VRVRFPENGISLALAEDFKRISFFLAFWVGSFVFIVETDLQKVHRPAVFAP
jgi:hypothetical protein